MTDIETRMVKLEQRVQTLEKLAQVGMMSVYDSSARMEAELVNSYGEHVDKSSAARILGVTRVTVYAMLADGRLEGAFGGRHVSVRSIARFICSGKRKEKGAHDDEGA